MACVIQLSDGSVHTIFDERDILSLVDERMGGEARTLIEELLSEHDEDADYIAALEREADGLRYHHRVVLEALQTQSETITALIQEKDIDRKALSAAVGNIGSITRREVNR